jgi:hypothetical protein
MTKLFKNIRIYFFKCISFKKIILMSYIVRKISTPIDIRKKIKLTINTENSY